MLPLPPLRSLPFLCLLFALPTHGAVAQTSPADSLELVRDARIAVRTHMNELRNFRFVAASAEESRAASERIIGRLDAIGARIPGDDWVVGQRVGMRILAGNLDEAMAVARDCRASGWWCDSLRGFVLHVRREFVAAGEAFDRSLGAMPTERRCEGLEVIGRYLLEGAYRSDFLHRSCAEQVAEEARLWWLADPLYMVAGNDRRTEHYARMVAMELHHQWLDVEGDRCDPRHHAAQIKQGWPAHWWSVDDWSRGMDEGEGSRFIPRSDVALQPFGTAPDDWSTRSSRNGEWYDVPYGPVAALATQMALFRRGDRLLATVAAEGNDLGFDPASVTAGLFLSGGPGDVRAVRPNDGSDSVRWVFSALTVPVPQLVGVELVAPGRGVARSRFGLLPEATKKGLGISDLLLWEWGDSVGSTIEQVLPRMLGSSRVPVGRAVGVYWEMYGAVPAGSVAISVSAEPVGRGLLSRVTDLLRLTDAPRGIRLAWSEGVPADGAEIRSRTISLDLSALTPGRYRLHLRARSGRQEVERTREIELFE